MHCFGSLITEISASSKTIVLGDHVDVLVWHSFNSIWFGHSKRQSFSMESRFEEKDSLSSLIHETSCILSDIDTNIRCSFFFWRWFLKGNRNRWTVGPQLSWAGYDSVCETKFSSCEMLCCWRERIAACLWMQWRRNQDLWVEHEFSFDWWFQTAFHEDSISNIEFAREDCILVVLAQSGQVSCNDMHRWIEDRLEPGMSLKSRILFGILVFLPHIPSRPQQLYLDLRKQWYCRDIDVREQQVTKWHG